MVPRCQSTIRIGALAGLLLFALAPGVATEQPISLPDPPLVYRALIPLGAESFAVEPWRSVLLVMASAANPRFEGVRSERNGAQRVLLDADGLPLEYYPRHLEFRVTASTRTRLMDAPPFPMRAHLTVNDYLLALRFRVKIFRGLRQTIVYPQSTVLIGEPADLPYAERIYRVSFDVGKVPITDRVVLEVIAPNGERLCKFHLDL